MTTLDAESALNRGFNLLAVTILALAGLAFGTVGFTENELPDKLDDFGLLAVGAIALVWYLAGSSRTRRTIVPVVLIVLAAVVQFVGVGLEHDDKQAFGDNIGGLFLFIPAVITVIFQYWRTGRLLGASVEGRQLPEDARLVESRP
jgi:uncharacterized membrane protein YGL010W